MSKHRRYNPQDVRLTEALEAANKVLRSNNIRFALIGGLAYGVHVEPRATKDVDIIILSKGVSTATKVFDILQKAGFDPQRNPDGTLRIGNMKDLKAYAMNFDGPRPLTVRLDVIASMYPFFEKAIQEAIYDEGLDVYVAPVEALIVLKALSYRSRNISPNAESRRKAMQDFTDYTALLQQPYDKDKLDWYAKEAGITLDRIGNPFSRYF